LTTFFERGGGKKLGGPGLLRKKTGILDRAPPKKTEPLGRGETPPLLRNKGGRELSLRMQKSGNRKKIRVGEEERYANILRERTKGENAAGSKEKC